MFARGLQGNASSTKAIQRGWRAQTAKDMLIKLGIDPTKLAGIMNTSTARCWSSDTYNPCPGVMEGVPSSNNYEGGFGAALMQKDLGLAVDAAKVRLGVLSSIGCWLLVVGCWCSIHLTQLSTRPPLSIDRLRSIVQHQLTHLALGPSHTI